MRVNRSKTGGIFLSLALSLFWAYAWANPAEESGAARQRTPLENNLIRALEEGDAVHLESLLNDAHQSRRGGPAVPGILWSVARLLAQEKLPGKLGIFADYFSTRQPQLVAEIGTASDLIQLSEAMRLLAESSSVQGDDQTRQKLLQNANFFEESSLRFPSQRRLYSDTVSRILVRRGQDGPVSPQDLEALLAPGGKLDYQERFQTSPRQLLAEFILERGSGSGTSVPRFSAEALGRFVEFFSRFGDRPEDKLPDPQTALAAWQVLQDRSSPTRDGQADGLVAAAVALQSAVPSSDKPARPVGPLGRVSKLAWHCLVQLGIVGKKGSTPGFPSGFRPGK